MVKINFDDTQDIAVPTEADLQLSDAAAQRIAQLKAKQTDPANYLRIAVIGGGCSGYSYKFEFIANKDNADVEVSNPDHPDIKVVVDMQSYDYMKGSIIDFEETLEASQFVIKNPKAKSSCGCGTSFSI